MLEASDPDERNFFKWKIRTMGMRIIVAVVALIFLIGLLVFHGDSKW